MISKPGERVPLEDQVFRTRYIAFLQEDADAFSRLAHERFPDLIFYPQVSDLITSGKDDIPDIPISSHIFDVRSGFLSFSLAGPAWKPELRWYAPAKGWRLKNSTWPSGRLHWTAKIGQSVDVRSHREFEYVMRAAIYVHCRRTVKSDLDFARQLLGLVGKVSSTRAMYVDLASNQPPFERPKGSGTIWIGKAAAAWCLEKPNRLCGVYGGARARGLRPLE